MLLKMKNVYLLQNYYAIVPRTLIKLFFFRYMYNEKHLFFLKKRIFGTTEFRCRANIYLSRSYVYKCSLAYIWECEVSLFEAIPKMWIISVANVEQKQYYTLTEWWCVYIALLLSTYNVSLYKSCEERHRRLSVGSIWQIKLRN